MPPAKVAHIETIVNDTNILISSGKIFKFKINESFQDAPPGAHDGAFYFNISEPCLVIA